MSNRNLRDTAADTIGGSERIPLVDNAADAVWKHTTPNALKDRARVGLPLDRGAWVASTAYIVGDRVTQGGRIYRCRTANSDSAFTAGKWEIIG